MVDLKSITASEIAERLGGRLDGDGSRAVTHVATLDNATADSVSWAGSERFVEKAKSSAAGVLIVPDDTKGSFDVPVIRMADADMAICEIQRWLADPVDDVPMGIDPTAVVDPTAKVDGACIGPRAVVRAGTVIGAGTQIHAGVYVGSDCVIGEDCVIWPNAVLRERTTIGDRVVIHPSVTIGSDGFGYLFRDGLHKKIPQTGAVVIEDDVEIGSGTAVDRARTGVTRVGAGTKIDNLCQIAHNVQIGADCMLVSHMVIGGSSSLGHHVVMGGQSGISDHVHVGDGVLIAAKTTVMKDFPDGSRVRGIPAVNDADFLRQQGTVRRLPKWIDRLKGLIKRVEALEESSFGKD